MTGEAGRSTILVVDDTPESLSFLTDTIERAGMTVLIATDGSAALELLDHITPDLVLMDAVMPVMDGFETTRRLKREPRFSHLPVIFMTGLTETEHVIEALEAGGVDYVRKPIVVDELLARIRVHLANARITHGSQSALDLTGRHLLSVDRDANVRWCTPRADALLAAISDDWSPERRELPPAIAQVVRRVTGGRMDEGTSARLDLAGYWLTFAQVDHPRPDEYLIRMGATRECDDIRLLQERHMLTSRESEVLLWISRGKPNREISDILGISPRTVNKHLEQVFEKLGVENRASAAAFAVRTLNG